MVKKKTKNPPFFSHEFVIQNHADIVACVAMVFVLGLMFQMSSSLASVFIVMQHNTTANIEIQPGVFQDIPFYTAGLKDVPAVFFYLLISVVMHAIIQEYLLDKVNKKLHLSKVKYNKFNESGQLLAFYLVSLFWGGDLILRENLLNVASIWETYPHNNMTFLLKFFFIIQISYWLHIFPELYFQKIKKEDMPPRIQYAVLYLAFIVSAYFLRFTRLALVLLVIHYLSEALFHVCRILAKQVASQEAEKAKFLVEKAEQVKTASIISAEGDSEAAELLAKAFKAQGEGLVELRRIETAEEIADHMAQSRNVVYLPTGQSTLLSLPQ